jgi:peptide/nickel transport system substrate-binding protein
VPWRFSDAGRPSAYKRRHCRRPKTCTLTDVPHGGIAQGVGQALLENSYYEPQSGLLLAASFMDYGMPRAEPLASWDPDGNLVPMLAAEIPNIENGGVAADGLSVTWKLKTGVQWHDGRPFTADDVVFNWEYASDPATAATTIGIYHDVEVEKVDTYTVRVRFKKPTPFWAGRANALIIPKHLFATYKGANSREAPTNLKPVGTGPYRFVDFAPGDFVKGERYAAYHVPNRPYFDTIEVKGGGDAVSAARAVIQTGDFDFAWNTQVEDEVLLKLENSVHAKGRVEIVSGMQIEHIQINTADPWTEVDGERSSAKTKHPLFSDPAVCRALSLLVDRGSIQAHIYGRTGVATGNFINSPERFVSKNTKWKFNVDEANQLLDEAGCARRTASVPRAARSLSSYFRPRSTRHARRLRRSRLFGQLPGRNKLKAGSRLLV